MTPLAYFRVTMHHAQLVVEGLPEEGGLGSSRKACLLITIFAIHCSFFSSLFVQTGREKGKDKLKSWLKVMPFCSIEDQLCRITYIIIFRGETGGVLLIYLKEGPELQTDFKATFKKQIFMFFIVENIFHNEI